VPTGNTSDALWSSFRREDGHYLAFLISFIVIAGAWSQHHHVMRFAERSDARLRTFNLLWLLTIILNPFATKLLTTEQHDTLGAHALRFGFYALLEVLATVTFVSLLHHMVARGLQSPEMPPRVASDAYWAGAGVLLGFGISIPLFFLSREAWLAWIAGPLLVRPIARQRRRRSGRLAGP
jgi:uncharacterized membrane protein